MDEKTLSALSKEELVQLVIEQSEEIKQMEIQLDSEIEQNRFIKGLGFVDGFPDVQPYFIRFFEDESEGTAKRGSIFLGILDDFVEDYGKDQVMEMLYQYTDDRV